MDNRGLYHKYNVSRTRDGMWEESFTFTLVPEKDQIAVAALLKYAELTPNKQLAQDLRNKLTELNVV